MTRNHISNNGATSGPAEGGVVAAGAGNIIDGNAIVSNAPASVTITAAANRTGVIRNTFTGGTAITDLGVGSVIGATTAGPGIVASTNTLTNVQVPIAVIGASSCAPRAGAGRPPRRRYRAAQMSLNLLHPLHRTCDETPPRRLSNPHFPALRSDPMVLWGASRKK